MLTENAERIPGGRDLFIPARFHLTVPWFLRSQWQLWSALLLIVLLPLGILLYLIQTQVNIRLEKQAASQNTLAARLVAQAIQERFDNLMSDVGVLSRRQALIAAAEKRDTHTARELLKEFVADNKEFDRALMVDPAGNLWTDYPADPSVLEKNFAERDWFAGVTRMKAVYVSEIYQRSAYPQPYLTAIAVPVRNAQRNVVAYVIGQLRIETLMSWLWLIKPAAGGTVRLIDHHGHLIKRPDSSEQPVVDISGELNALMARAGPDFSTKGADPFTGASSLVSIAKVESIGWTVLAAQPVASILETVRQIQAGISALFVFFLFLMLFLGFMSLNAVRRYHKLLFRLQESRERYFGRLEQAVNERKEAEGRVLNANRELKSKIDELARLNRIMMDRENRVLELKEKIRGLEKSKQE